MDIQEQPVADSSVWQGVDLHGDRSWEYHLTDVHRQELDEALQTVNRNSWVLPEITRERFPLPQLASRLNGVGAQLQSGRGFALLHGFPVDGYAYADLEKMYWGLCSHIGIGVTQNSEAGFIHYVTDGTLRPNQGTRGVGLPKETVLHVDLSDVASLLCARQAPDDPPSRVASSTTTYNEILRRRPDLLPRLYAGFEWDRMGEHDAAESATSGYRVPLFSATNGFVSCQYNRHWIASANERNQSPLLKQDIEALDLIDEIARATCFEFPFHQGDIQFCNNYTVMHGRAAHEVVVEEERKRVLLRIWMNTPGFRQFSDEAIIRHGIGCHGRLGWSAPEVLAGMNQAPRQRRADGAVSLA
jgi:hypothetical protein